MNRPDDTSQSPEASSSVLGLLICPSLPFSNVLRLTPPERILIASIYQELVELNSLSVMFADRLEEATVLEGTRMESRGPAARLYMSSLAALVKPLDLDLLADRDVKVQSFGDTDCEISSLRKAINQIVERIKVSEEEHF